MPIWPHPQSPCIARAVAAHEQAFGEVSAKAVAPATWPLVGEHTDHFGGVVVVGLHSAQLAVAISPRVDATFVVDEHNLSEDFTDYDTARSTASGFDVHGQALGPVDSTAARLAGLVHTMMHRQLLSRETAGFNVTIVSDIPRHAGLGRQVAVDAAAALAFASHLEELDSPPVRTKLAEVCFQSSEIFSPTAQVRARYVAALRGQAGYMQVIDYADGSITQAPLPFGDKTGAQAFVVIPPTQPGGAVADEVRKRTQFIDQAQAAFGAESLRLLPDASTRVVDWLRAVHQVVGDEGVPAVDEASLWLQFMDQEIAAATKATAALRSRKLADLVPAVATSSENLATLFGLGQHTQALQQLCLHRGAVVARPLEAGTTGAVLAVVAHNHGHNFAADLSADGLGVVPVGTPEATASGAARLG